MEMGIRGWMIVIGILLVLAVLLDGYRRMRNDHRGSIRMSLRMGGGFEKDGGDETGYTSELPNGGARVATRNGQVLMPDDAANGSDEDELPSMTATGDDFEPDAFASGNDLQGDPLMDAVIDDEAELEKASQNNSQSGEKKGTPSYEEIIVINVMSKDAGGFNGEDLLHILLACDLRLGDMKILHRYEKENAEGPVQFSIANILEPGVFDMDNIKSFATPGITFFFGMPGPTEPMKAFDYMVETAQCVAKNLNGELKDEARSAVTDQTLEHSRQRIKDYERRQLMQHA